MSVDFMTLLFREVKSWYIHSYPNIYLSVRYLYAVPSQSLASNRETITKPDHRKNQQDKIDSHLLQLRTVKHK